MNRFLITIQRRLRQALRATPQPATDEGADELVVRLARSPSYEAMRDLLSSDPWLLSDDARDRLMNWRDSVPDPALAQHLDRLVWIVDHCRRRGVVEVITELTLIDGQLHTPTRRSGSPPDDEDDSLALKRVILPSAKASERLSRHGEREFYTPVLQKIEISSDEWLQALARAENDQRNLTEHFESGLDGREREVANALRAFSVASQIDFTEIPVTWIKLGSPNAMTVWEPKDKGAAIGLDLVLINKLVLVAFAGMHAMREHDEQIVARTAQLLGELLKGGAPPALEPWLLSLHDEVADLRGFLDGIGASAMQFVLGHELGHLALDQFKSGKSAMMAHEVLGTVDDTDDSDASVSCFPQHDLEYAADRWAAKHLQLVAREAGTVTGVVLSKAVPPIYFAAADLMGAFTSPSTKAGKISSRTHPPAWERAKKLGPGDGTSAVITASPQFAPLLDLPSYLHGVAESRR